MLKAIIEELEKIKPCYSLDTFNAKVSFLESFFFVVDFGEKEGAGRFSHMPMFVYIYAPPQVFILRELKEEVARTLHKKKFEKKDSKGFFWVEFVRVVFSRIDKPLGKQCLCMEFRVPAI